MFKFNFNTTEGEGEPASSVDVQHSNDLIYCQHAWRPTQKYSITNVEVTQKINRDEMEEVVIGSIKIHYVKPRYAEDRLQLNEKSSQISAAIKQHTDLVPAIYEGGLKIWECTWDLLEHLNRLIISGLKLEGSNVLELGCGAALPAIYAALSGASITVQDYNEEVLRCSSVPNMILNLTNSIILNNKDIQSENDLLVQLNSKVKFYSGDWQSLPQLLLDDELSLRVNGNFDSKENVGKYDVILTSETIYNPECHDKLINIFTKCLKSCGIVLIAAKSHYFGIGGGTRQFINKLQQTKLFSVATVSCNNEGVKREIITLKFILPT